MYINVEREKRDRLVQTDTDWQKVYESKKIWLIDRLADRQTDWLLNWGGREEVTYIIHSPLAGVVWVKRLFKIDQHSDEDDKRHVRI